MTGIELWLWHRLRSICVLWSLWRQNVAAETAAAGIHAFAAAVAELKLPTTGQILGYER